MPVGIDRSGITQITLSSQFIGPIPLQEWGASMVGLICSCRCNCNINSSGRCWCDVNVNVQNAAMTDQQPVSVSKQPQSLALFSNSQQIPHLIVPVSVDRAMPFIFSHDEWCCRFAILSHQKAKATMTMKSGVEKAKKTHFSPPLNHVTGNA